MYISHLNTLKELLRMSRVSSMAGRLAGWQSVGKFPPKSLKTQLVKLTSANLYYYSIIIFIVYSIIILFIVSNKIYI